MQKQFRFDYLRYMQANHANVFALLALNLHCLCRYVTGSDGYKRLQTVRLDADTIAMS